MKVKILQRSVYYKTAEVEIDVPNDIHEDEIQEYINDNEELWVDEIDKKIADSELLFGNGMDSGDWTDEDQDSEWRYDIKGMNYGGHL